MKKTFFAVLLLLGSRFAIANEVTDELTRLVNSWNESHNTRDIEQFKELYSAQVLFYGKYRSGNFCAERKAKFLNENFSQRIVTPLETQFFSSGTVKCSFTKEVTYKQLVKQHPSYLLFKEENGSYHITGESDLETDQNLHVQLDLGSEVASSSSHNGSITFLFFALVIIIGIGARWVYRKKVSKRSEEDELSQYYVSATEPAPALLSASFQQSTTAEPIALEQSAVKQKTPAVQTEPIISDKEKGDAFEKYVLSLFDLSSGRFRLIDWRSDKITKDGHYALSNHHPDMVLELKNSKGYHRFAIECKWRSDYHNGSIEWAKEYQIRNYQAFQNEMKMPVFIVIGVGGTPAAPKQMHVVELNQVTKYTVLFQSTLKKYSKFVPSTFFYDPYQRILK